MKFTSRTCSKEDLARERGEFFQSLLKPAAQPTLPQSTFKAAVPSPALALKMGYQGNNIQDAFRKAGSKLSQYDGKIGLLVASGKGYNAGNAAKNMAQALYALDFGISEYGCIVGLLEENLNIPYGAESMEFDPDRAAQLGIEVVYDVAGLLGQGSIDCSHGALRIGTGCLEFDDTAVDKGDWLNAITRQETLREMSSIARKYRIIRESFYYRDADYAPMLPTAELCTMLSFGRWTLDELPVGHEPHDGYKCPMPLELVGKGMIKGLVRTDLVERLDSLCRIWRQWLNNYGLVFDLDAVSKSGNMEELGRCLGIDAPVSALMQGIPAEDILA